MENNALLQFLVSAVSGGLIVLFAYLVKNKKGPKIVIGKKAGLIIVGTLFLFMVVILLSAYAR